MAESNLSIIPPTTALGGTLVRDDDGWRWNDGTPAPHVRDEKLRYFAPNLRCCNRGGRTYVEIPHNWRTKYQWDGSSQIEEAIAELVEEQGQPGEVFAEGLAEMADEHRLAARGYLVPIEAWDAVMNEPAGISWDREHEDAILAKARELGWQG